MDYRDVTFPAASREQVAAIQKARKRLAFERARLSPFYKGRLDHVKADHLDQPEEWRKIPVLTKDELRNIPAEGFHDAFAIAPDTLAVEYWRSGGATGRPLFYPRSAEDMEVALEMWRRLWLSAGCNKDDKAHISFPMGIHPVGQLYARSGEMLGIGTIWAGSGNNTPSELQLDLIRTLRPSVWVGMPSYGLQLASLAQKQGFDISECGVCTILCAAEPLSLPKRQKLERLWGAKVYDQFGCTEGGAMGSESDAHDGLHLWSDLFFIEVVNEATGEAVAPGEAGILLITPLFTNTMTPFLRWSTGDIGVLKERGATKGPLSVYPVFQHAARTAGFFKVKGININHADFEDFMHRNPAVIDFRLEVHDRSGIDALLLQIELMRGADHHAEAAKLMNMLKTAFEVTPQLEILETGRLAQLFLTDVKARRFVDGRSR
ncbi:phenylacetate--CoA ligase family protein [Pseudorhodoplanes sp.]|uniref:phenylacetate--CoA ligase family protein n=1 Tax=Pseudorhodoplanes sp. TaxID=1934341 RepID=UPI00391C0E00